MANQKTWGGLIDFFFKDPTTCCLQETHFSIKDTYTASEGMEKDIPHKWKPKETWGSYIS